MQLLQPNPMLKPLPKVELIGESIGFGYPPAYTACKAKLTVSPAGVRNEILSPLETIFCQVASAVGPGVALSIIIRLGKPWVIDVTFDSAKRVLSPGYLTVDPTGINLLRLG